MPHPGIRLRAQWVHAHNNGESPKWISRPRQALRRAPLFGGIKTLISTAPEVCVILSAVQGIPLDIIHRRTGSLPSGCLPSQASLKPKVRQQRWKGISLDYVHLTPTGDLLFISGVVISLIYTPFQVLKHHIRDEWLKDLPLLTSERASVRNAPMINRRLTQQTLAKFHPAQRLGLLREVPTTGLSVMFPCFLEFVDVFPSEDKPTRPPPSGPSLMERPRHHDDHPFPGVGIQRTLWRRRKSASRSMLKRFLVHFRGRSSQFSWTS